MSHLVPMDNPDFSLTLNPWIDVKDQLPNDGQRVLIAVMRPDGKAYLWSSTFDIDGEFSQWHLCREEYEEGDVTHWRHLPDPPFGVSWK